MFRNRTVLLVYGDELFPSLVLMNFRVKPLPAYGSNPLLDAQLCSRHYGFAYP
jgi:hypothetical protein